MSLVYKVHKVVPKAFSKGVLLQRFKELLWRVLRTDLRKKFIKLMHWLLENYV